MGSRIFGRVRVRVSRDSWILKNLKPLRLALGSGITATGGRQSRWQWHVSGFNGTQLQVEAATGSVSATGSDDRDFTSLSLSATAVTVY